MTLKLSELAARVQGEVLGDPGLEISGVNSLADAKPSELSFYASPKFREDLLKTKAGAVLVSSEVSARNALSIVRVANPQLAFAYISQFFHPERRPAPGTHARAWVHPEANVDPSATVMAAAYVDRNASVGARSVLYPGSFVGEEARVGQNCILHPNAVVAQRCVVGDRVILHAGCVVGADGFGFAFDAEKSQHVKIPQIGIVRIEDDVEIGAGSCIDRATLGETVIRRGSKLDNLVQIGHNVTVGPLALICAQVGVSGSSQIGAGVILAGQVGIADHVRVGDKARILAQSGVPQDVESGSMVTGYPAIPRMQWLRSVAIFNQLPELLKEVKDLQRRIEELEQREKI